MITAAAMMAFWASAGPGRAQVAFLDALDRVVVDVSDQPVMRPDPSAFKVYLDGKPQPVSAAEGIDFAAEPVGPNFLNLPGNFQGKLGDSDWNPSGRSTELTRVEGNRYELIVVLPAGTFEYKLARGGSWAENYGRDFRPGGENLKITVPSEQMIRFLVDLDQKLILNSLEHPAQVEAPRRLPLKPPTVRKCTAIALTLRTGLDPSAVSKRIEVVDAAGSVRRVYAREVLNGDEFTYSGPGLGADWSRHRTEFRVWSPVASSVTLVVQDPGGKRPPQRVRMKPAPKGVWETTLFGDLHGEKYRYELVSYGKKRTAADIYGVAATPESDWSVVVDLSRTNPPGWPARRPFISLRQQDAVIYEAHIRDLTIDPSSGVPAAHRGKYLGLTASDGKSMPLDRLAALGITHLHLLPFQNFNPANSKTYNWGYETTLFNVPEEQYSTQPSNPIETIRQTKQMIMALQQKGIGAVLDVVYNHSVPSEGPGSAFWETVPYYYFRTDNRGTVLNESGVGNALHDERPMVRKFIAESLRFWASEYRLDGFRFDLMGMFTPESVRTFESVIRKVNPAALVYGEPWTGGGPNRSPKGSFRGTRIAVFNDDFRNLFRGDTDGDGPGLLMRPLSPADDWLSAVKGKAGGFPDSPEQTVNYVSAHDNLSLRDKIAKVRPGLDPVRQSRLASTLAGLVLLSQGVPFLEGGVEIGRTKGGNANSYNAGDAVNRFVWPAQTPAAARELAQLIAIRKAHPIFRLPSQKEAEGAITQDTDVPPNALSWRIERRGIEDPWARATISINLDERPLAIGSVADEVFRNDGQPKGSPLLQYGLMIRASPGG